MRTAMKSLRLVSKRNRNHSIVTAQEPDFLNRKVMVTLAYFAAAIEFVEVRRDWANENRLGTRPA